MPTWFIPHGGGPCFFMDWDPPHEWDRMSAFLRGIGERLPARPSAIVVISAHWLSSDVCPKLFPLRLVEKNNVVIS